MSNRTTPGDVAWPTVAAFPSRSEWLQPQQSTAVDPPVAALEIRTTPPPLHGAHEAVMLPATRRENGSPQAVARAVHVSPTDDSDPPFRTPAGWLNKDAAPHQRRAWQWSERSTAAFLGFAAGIMIIVPTVMYLSVASDQLAPKNTLAADELPRSTHAAPTVDTLPSPVKAASMAGMASGSWLDTASPPIVPAAEQLPNPAASIATNSDNGAGVERRASLALSQGRVAEARDLLRKSASPDVPHLWFVLAETYDPLRTTDGPLNANPIDNLMSADIKFARYYYERALTYGVTEAHARLEALRPEVITQQTARER